MVFNIFQFLAIGISPEFEIIAEIGAMIIIATIFAFFVKLTKQPSIPAYIFTGIVIGPLFFGLIEDPELIASLSQIGVAFLIFTAGLEIKFRKLKEVGKVSFVGGILQMAILFFIAFFVSTWMGFAGLAPVYIGLVVAFSSTMIVVALLAEKREINSLHGRIIIGILLIQDIAAIIALTILSTSMSLNSISVVVGKAIIFAVIAFMLSKIINPVLRKSADNQELLLLVSISFLFLFIIGSFYSNLSLIIGAFFAGVALANSDYKTEIQGKITPLREFFSVIFFVTLGMQLKLFSENLILLFLVLLILVIIIKPLITMMIVRIFRYKKRTSFFAGNALAQTSEFSLIIVTLGLALGNIDEGLFSVLVLLTILTMSLTSYLISYEKKLITIFGFPLNPFEGIKTNKEELEFHHKDGKKIIIFGCHRIGSLFLKEFGDRTNDIFVVDYNPEIIKSLIDKKIPCIYGDFMNDEVFERADVKNAEIVISTIPDFDDNLLLIKRTKRKNSKAKIIVSASRISEALELYRAGADYVILPKVIGGQKGVDLVRKIKCNKIKLRELKKEHLDYLKSVHHLMY